MEFYLLFSCQVVSDSEIPWSVTHQTSLSEGFLRQEYWNELLLPSPGDLPNPGIELQSPALQAGSLPLTHQRSRITLECQAI